MGIGSRHPWRRAGLDRKPLEYLVGLAAAEAEVADDERRDPMDADLAGLVASVVDARQDQRIARTLHGILREAGVPGNRGQVVVILEVHPVAPMRVHGSGSEGLELPFIARHLG